MDITVVAIVFGVLFGITAVGWLVYYLAKRGVNMKGIVDKVQDGIDVADTITDALVAVAPNAVTSTLQKIVDAAKVAVDSAEQLYLNDSITADQRKATATDTLKRALALDGIAYEGDVSALGDAAMEAAVNALPNTAETKAAKAVANTQPVAAAAKA